MKRKNPIVLFTSWLAVIFTPLHAVSAADSPVGNMTAPGQNLPRGSGQVSGRIRNLATGDFLRSAVVKIEGTTLSTLSDFSGAFSITLPPGTHHLLVSYTGLDPVRVPVTVAAGEIVTRPIDLTSSVYTLQAFHVTGEREGNALAIQMQRLAPNLKTVVATDAYGNPATNPAELLQRLAGISADTITGGEIRSIAIRGMGPEFSTMMIDGETVANSQGSSANRVWQPEQFGTGNLSSVELIKAPTPDQDANAVAGYVNLVTRRAFEQPGRRVNLTLGSMWRDRDFSESPFQDRFDNLDLIAISYSDVFNVLGGKQNLGVVISASRRVSTTVQDESGNLYSGLNSYYLNPASENPLTRFFGTGDFEAPTEAHTVGLSIDYKLSDDAYAFVKVSYNTNDQRQELFRMGIGHSVATIANFSPGSTYEHSFLLPSAASTATARTVVAPRKAINYGFNTGLDQKLFNQTATLSLRANYSYADLELFGTTDVQAVATGIGFEIDRRGRDKWYPVFNQTDGPSVYDPASYRMSTLTETDQTAPNELYGLRADFTKNLAAAIPVYFKVGAKYNDSQREQKTTQVQSTWVGVDRLPNSGDDVMTPYAQVRYRQGGGRYGPFPFVPIPKQNSPGDPTNAPAGYWAQSAANIYNSYNTSNAGTADFGEKICAAYVSGHINLGNLRILSGLRVENTEVSGTAWVRDQTAAWGGNSVGGSSFDPAVVAANLARGERSFVSRRTAHGEYRKVFPGLHFVYEPQKDFLIRTSYNRSITRPPVGNLLPTAIESPITSSVTIGNPNLQPYFSDNFELNFEKYFEPVGVFSAGVFLKQIKDYFRSVTSAAGPEGIDGNGLYANYNVTTSMNVGSARVRGAEISYQQQFSFLPGFWKGLGTFANFTYLETVGNFGTLVTSNRLPGLPPRIANAGVSYINYGWQVRFLGNWRDRTFGGTSGGIDYDRAERLSFDMKLQYRINRRYDVYCDIVNITDAPVREDVSQLDLPWIKNTSGVAYSIGVNARF